MQTPEEHENRIKALFLARETVKTWMDLRLDTHIYLEALTIFTVGIIAEFIKPEGWGELTEALKGNTLGLLKSLEAHSK